MAIAPQRPTRLRSIAAATAAGVAFIALGWSSLAQAQEVDDAVQIEDDAVQMQDDGSILPDDGLIYANEDESDDAIANEEEGEDGDDGWEVVEEPDDIGEPIQPEDPDSFHAPIDLPVVERAESNAPQETTQTTPSVEPPMRSMGGAPVRDGAAPWQAQIYAPFPPEKFHPPQVRFDGERAKEPWELQHACGGALIAANWIVTAAHCVNANTVRLGYRVRLAAENFKRDDGQTFRIVEVIQHPNYRNFFADDIALVRFAPDRPVPPRPPSQVRAISLYRGADLPPGAAVTATGWGKTFEGGSPSPVLLKVDLRLMSQANCAALPNFGPRKIHAGVMCAAAPRKRTCRGDSGGPVVLTNGQPILVGLVSWGEKCAEDGKPSVFTRLNRYASWIDGVIGARR